MPSGAGGKSAQGFVLHTAAGDIKLLFRPDAAPETVRYIQQAIQDQLYNSGARFYRSDFVIQGGIHGKKNPAGDLKINETKQYQVLSNGPGTAAIAHWDVPDC